MSPSRLRASGTLLVAISEGDIDVNLSSLLLANALEAGVLVGMLLSLQRSERFQHKSYVVGLQIYIGAENHKSLLKAVLLFAEVVVGREMLLLFCD